MRGQASSKNADEWVPEKVNDEAIIFQDGEWVLACEDSLGRKALAEHIAGAIPGLRPPFTVAIYGGWGEGKTHLLKSVEREIKEIGESAKADEKYQTVWFDLWQHQNDVNPVVSMLQVARDKLNDNGNFAEIAKTVGEVLTACLVSALDVSPTLSTVGRMRVSYKQHRNEQLKAKMAIQEDQVRLHDLFRKALDALTKDGPLVFFIDDLDRCLPRQTVDLLESIRLFMNHGKCIFIIGVDEAAVIRAINEDKGYGDPEIATHYLEKMVQYAFDLPPVEAGTRKEFIAGKLRARIRDWIPQEGNSSEDEVNSEGGEAYEDQIVDLWIAAFDDPEVVATVRLMVRTVNTFSIDHAIGLSQLKEDYDPLIMATLSIIRTCYREAFSRLRRRHDARLKSLWKLLFEYDDSSEDKMLDSLFHRGGKKSDDQPRLGWAFVQNVQALMGKRNVPIDDGFVQKVEAHFRLASVAESDLGLSERSGMTSDSVGAIESKSDQPPAQVPALEVDTQGRLPGLVDYFLRRPAAEEEVGAACEQISNMTSLPGGLVNLNGIQWRVLDVVAGSDSRRRALLLSDRVIGTGPYNKAFVEMTWERCDLRLWLNDVFKKSLGEPFTRRIINTKVDNGPNPIWGVDGGKSTNDWFFLLSIDQAVQYLAGHKNVEWKQYKKVNFRSEKLIAHDEEGNAVWWWLRSPGRFPRGAAVVGPGGDVDDRGRSVDSYFVAVRPALWFNLES